MAFVTGIGDTPFGRHEGSDTLSLMARAATAALDDAGLQRTDIDGLLTGYSTTLPHLMLATLFAEYFGLAPSYAHGLQVGGATGFAMTMLANILVDSGQCRHVLVVAGENRATGQSRDSAVETLAQVGSPDFEIPFGPTIPAYYALVASRYMQEYRVGEEDLADLAVMLRTHAALHPGAQFREPISRADVLASKPIARPLKLLDCCPISDGAVAFTISAHATDTPPIQIIGAGQAHSHQHVSAAPSLTRFGAADAASRALASTGITRERIDVLGIYDSFTITLAILLEELGFAERGGAAAAARAGRFDRTGTVPLNTHGGLLSYGHCGVAGGMAHIAEVCRQLGGRAGPRQAKRPPAIGFVHGDGGVLSSHVSLLLERL